MIHTRRRIRWVHIPWRCRLTTRRRFLSLTEVSLTRGTAWIPRLTFPRADHFRALCLIKRQQKNLRSRQTCYDKRGKSSTCWPILILPDGGCSSKRRYPIALIFYHTIIRGVDLPRPWQWFIEFALLRFSLQGQGLGVGHYHTKNSIQLLNHCEDKSSANIRETLRLCSLHPRRISRRRASIGAYSTFRPTLYQPLCDWRSSWISPNIITSLFRLVRNIWIHILRHKPSAYFETEWYSTTVFLATFLGYVRTALFTGLQFSFYLEIVLDFRSGIELLKWQKTPRKRGETLP